MTDINDKNYISRIVEALIFASSKPVSSKDLLPYIGDFESDEIIQIIQKRYNETSGIELQKISAYNTPSYYAFRTHPDLAARLNIERNIEKPLSRVATEVLSIIAYHQPITRSEIEDIRGISLSRGTIDILLEHEWIKPLGRRRTPGRPLTWGTTIAFLDYFGLASLDDLPGMDELKSTGLIRKGATIGGLDEGSSVTDESEENNYETNIEDSI